MNINADPGLYNEERANREEKIVKDISNLMDFSRTIALRISLSLDPTENKDVYLFDINRTAWPIVSIKRICFEYSLGLLCDGRIAVLRRTLYPREIGPYCYVCDAALDGPKVIGHKKISVDYGLKFDDFFKNLIRLAKRLCLPDDEITEWEGLYDKTMEKIAIFVSEF